MKAMLKKVEETLVLDGEDHPWIPGARAGKLLQEVRQALSQPDPLAVALKRAINALNMPRNFVTDEGIKSYTLIPELEKVLKEHLAA